MSTWLQIKLAIVAVLGIIFILFLLAVNPLVTIDAGERGVVLAFGAFKGEVMQPGLHFRTPFVEDVIQMNVQTQKHEAESLTYSKDLQTVTIQSAIAANPDPQFIGAIYQDVGLAYIDKLLLPALQAVVKQTIAQYTAEELVTHRLEAQEKIETTLRERVAPQHILVTQYSLLNEDFDDRYEKAISEKQVEEQNAQKAKYVTAQKEQEKQQAILSAQAQAETSRLQAEALKTQGGEIVIEKIKAEAMLEAAKKWNGVLPTQMIPGSTVPFINLSK